MSFLCVVKDIIFMAACDWYLQGLVLSLYNENMWMSAALWGISGNMTRAEVQGCYQQSYSYGAWFIEQ